MHAVAFARQGLRAAAADLSPAMIDRARQNAAAAGVAVESAGCRLRRARPDFPSGSTW